MRQLGRLLIEVRKISPIKHLNECFDPKNFDILLEAVRILCCKTEGDDRPSMESPSLALKLGHHLRKCAAIERGKPLEVET